MIDQLLTYCDPDTLTAFICILMGCMGAFLYANQVRIERDGQAAVTTAFNTAKAMQEWLSVIDQTMSTKSAVEGIHGILRSHTKLIHDLTPKKKNARKR